MNVQNALEEIGKKDDSCKCQCAKESRDLLLNRKVPAW